MKKRRIFFTGLAALTMLAGLGFGISYVFRDPVNPGACVSIREGMTEAEVIQILGRSWNRCYGVLGVKQKTWQGPNGDLIVVFDEADSVQSVGFSENDTLFRKLRCWAGLDDDGPHYLGGSPPQCCPPTLAYPLPKELNSLEEAHAEAEIERYWSEP